LLKNFFIFFGTPPPPHILADQLTLSEPGGSTLCPPHHFVSSLIFRPYDGPDFRSTKIVLK
jgi:hypothetical protein